MIFAGERLEPPAQQARHAVDALEESRREHDVEHRIGHRHGERIAAEGRAVGPGGHADRGALGDEASADREAAAQRLGGGEHVRRHPFPFMGEELAGAAHAALHLVIDQHQAELVADRTQAPEIALRRASKPALALHRLDQDAGGLLADLGTHLVEIAEGDMVEARRGRAESLEILLVAGSGERRERAPVEGAGTGDEPGFLGMAGLGLVFARHLDGAFHRLGAGIAEKDAVGEGVVDEAPGNLLLARHLEQVGAMPELLRLLGQPLDEIRMAMAQRGDGDAAGEVEILLAGAGEEIGALAPLERQIGPSIGR